MTKCEFIYSDWICICNKCGFKAKLNEKCNIVRECKTTTFIEKLQNLNKTGEEWVAQGNPIASPVSVESRLEICKTCENFDANSTSCKLCGCNMNLKTRLQSAHCPINKW